MNMLEDSGVVVGIGSACSGSKRGNRVLTAMNVGVNVIESTIRISLSPLTTKDEATEAAEIIKQQALKLRSANVG